MHGGKSYFLRWAAIGLLLWFYKTTGKSHVPVGLFSEDYPTLRDRQISRISTEFPQWLGTLKSTQDEGHCFFLKPEYGGGRILLRNLDDPSKYMSTEFAAILVEELTKNPLETFQRLRTRLRYPDITETKFVGATNPGGPGHVWCQKYWLLKNTSDPEQHLFQYLRATLDDNRFTTDSYRLQLEGLPERERKAYRDGDWNAFAGQFFSSFRETSEINPFQIPAEWYLVGSLDPGWASPLSFGLQARDFEGNIYRIGTYYVADKSPKEHASAIKSWIVNNPYTGGRMPSLIVSGHDAWAKKDKHAVIANEITLADVFRAEGLVLSKAMVDRYNGWGALKQAMAANRYFVFRGHNDQLVEQFIQTQGEDNDPDDISGKGNDPDVEDHAIDDARYGNAALFKPMVKAPAPPKTPSTLADMMQPNYLEKMFERKMKQAKRYA